MEIKKVSVFSLRLVPISGPREQFLCEECVSMSSVGFLVLGDKPIREVYHPKKNVKIVPPN